MKTFHLIVINVIYKIKRYLTTVLWIRVLTDANINCSVRANPGFIYNCAQKTIAVYGNIKTTEC